MENQFRKALESGHRLFGTHVNVVLMLSMNWVVKRIGQVSAL